MNLLEAIAARHSVRAYTGTPLQDDVARRLQDEIDAINAETGFHFQLVRNEPTAFQSRMAKYGKFSDVTDYLILAVPRSTDADLLAGYHGERLVLLAQTLGLNTCWVGLTYKKVTSAFTLAPGERVACCIAIGYGATQGVGHKLKEPADISNLADDSPDWFRRGIEAVRLAPSAVHQQKFFFRYEAPRTVVATRRFSLIGYTKMDLGIARLHFELAAGRDNFDWGGE